MSWPMSPEHGSGLGHASSKPNSAGILGRTQTAGRRGSKSVRGETEALNHIIDGHALMHLGDQTFDVFAGGTICIIPGNEHCNENISSVNQVLLCCCSPAYAHDDTVLVA